MRQAIIRYWHEIPPIVRVLLFMIVIAIMIGLLLPAAPSAR
jgi:hypothetical protein